MYDRLRGLHRPPPPPFPVDRPKVEPEAYLLQIQLVETGSYASASKEWDPPKGGLMIESACITAYSPIIAGSAWGMIIAYEKDSRSVTWEVAGMIYQGHSLVYNGGFRLSKGTRLKAYAAGATACVYDALIRLIPVGVM